MIRRERADVILYKLVPLLILHPSTLPLGRYSLPFRLRRSRLLCCFDVRQSFRAYLQGVSESDLPARWEGNPMPAAATASSQRKRINCSFHAVPYVLRARNLLAQEPEPSYSSKCQKKVRVLSFLKRSLGSP
jgi:hypothetical protein